MKPSTLKTLLSANSAYAAALGSHDGGIKLYPAGNVQQGVRRPYAAFTQVSRVEAQDKSARGIYTVNIQIDHYANSIDQAAELEALCIAALNRYKGEVDGQKIKSIRVQGGNDGFQEGQEANHRLTEFSIKIQG